ncbi:MAG: hypothetical protein A2231_10425 [Candidatus Firestonebacteria bacterium RIFOXYA2_FULL_40_8]|nr:MAG: hypothetical protein A2231_10425 [Candidatus Firestonebacteria bacterium RIFOXYA2_FULL_40_8]
MKKKTKNVTLVKKSTLTWYLIVILVLLGFLSIWLMLIAFLVAIFLMFHKIYKYIVSRKKEKLYRSLKAYSWLMLIMYFVALTFYIVLEIKPEYTIEFKMPDRTQFQKILEYIFILSAIGWYFCLILVKDLSKKYLKVLAVIYLVMDIVSFIFRPSAIAELSLGSLIFNIVMSSLEVFVVILIIYYKQASAFVSKRMG